MKKPKSEILEHDPRPELGHMVDGEVIQQSEAQINPYLAKPTDFEISDVTAEVPAHGQCGKNRKEYLRLLAKSAEDRGKSPFATKP